MYIDGTRWREWESRDQSADTGLPRKCLLKWWVHVCVVCVKLVTSDHHHPQVQHRAGVRYSEQSPAPSSQTYSHSWRGQSDIAAAASVTPACCESHTNVAQCCRPWYVDLTPDCWHKHTQTQSHQPNLYVVLTFSIVNTINSHWRQLGNHCFLPLTSLV